MLEKTDLQIDENSDRCDDKVTDSKFKIGDVVICNVEGRGVVVEIHADSKYPIKVSFDNKGYYEYYTENGRMYLDADDNGEHIRHLTKLERALS